MAECLFPISIKVDTGNSIPVSVLKYRNIRPYKHDYIQVPCGKCINCLKNRQNAMVSRCCAEAEKRGSMVFVTLTYNDLYLPLAQSTYVVDKRTGELFRKNLERKGEDGNFYMVSKPEIVHSARTPNKALSSRMSKIIASPEPRYLDTVIYENEDFRYFSRVTPSCNRLDVRLWLKAARVQYERLNGCKLDFTYACVEEMGPKTCRPHYHLVFFGLKKEQVDFLVDRWQYGFTKVEKVNAINEDKSNGYLKVSRYVGKYMSKGVFECSSVKTGDAEKPRIFQSRGLGASLAETLRSYMCCFNMYGEFDLDTFYCPALGRPLNEKEIDKIVLEIPNRLSYAIDKDCRLPVPRVVRDKIFKHQNPTDPTKKISTTVFALVQFYIRSEHDRLHRQEFEEFCACNPERDPFEICTLFENQSRARALAQDKAGKARLQAFYARTKVV